MYIRGELRASWPAHPGNPSKNAYRKRRASGRALTRTLAANKRDQVAMHRKRLCPGIVCFGGVSDVLCDILRKVAVAPSEEPSGDKPPNTAASRPKSVQHGVDCLILW